jgi:hypothetical protein
MSLQKLASRCLCGTPCHNQLSRNKRHAERRKITAINPPMMFGQAKPVRPTNSAAARTPTFDATSLREHSNMLNMFTFPQRKHQSSARQIKFATSAALPNRASGPMPEERHSQSCRRSRNDRDAESQDDPSFASAAPASLRVPCVLLNDRLMPRALAPSS